MDARYSTPELAWEYDQRNPSVHSNELEWYRSRLGKPAVAKSVLEFACGTGRLTIPLAEHGYSIIAVDNAKPMLERLERKLQGLSKQTASRVRTVCADMVDYVPATRPFAVVVPYNSLKYLESLAELDEALRHFKELMQPECCS